MDKKEQLMQVQTGLVATAGAVKVTCQQDADKALKWLGEIKAWRKSWVEYWRELKENAMKAHREICAKEKQGTEPIDQAEMIVKGKLIDWQREEAEKAQAEQRRLQAIADEQARKERERLEAQAARLKTDQKKQERIEQAQAVVAPVITIEAPKMKGTVETWEAEVTCRADLLKLAGLNPEGLEASFLMVDQSALNRFAKSTRGTVNVHGVRFVKKIGLSVR